ncbi:Werner Syndrome-like exonuclease [Anopheles stephensi]|uniref:Werner Syndrome-like exonuclease n=1 Tax=Anopheles stephensi TaxID=30069 RepID=UPI001658A7AD|nr:Werner Syndrome-like exonuclease [Anopheles stephensi]XP_035911289.1 Werner Syndrome-like exonuclease [Anopheles stephensi]XP_035911296.1 Werner Syndrome-like exonuclease [Anopheles stephensi]
MSKRKLPLWACSAVKHEPAEDGGSTVKPDAPIVDMKQGVPTSVKNEDAPKRRLRSNYVFPAEETKKPDTKVEYLPFIEYTGAIEYYTTLQDMAFRCDQLMQEITQQLQSTDQDIPIAFDLEWPFSFKTGPGRTALMQLCVKTDCCLLLQISCLKRLPAALTQLLYHPRVVLHGVNIKNDFRKLARDFPEVDADRLIARCVELGQWYNRLNGSTGLWSLARLVEQLLRLRMNKSKQVRMSKWDVLPLSEDQKLYAAIDVYIGQKLYLNLAEKQRQQENVNNCVPEANIDTKICLKVEGPETADAVGLPLTNSNHNPKQPVIGL